MDDLKIVFYIVVAIIWVVYNNYKKISETSKKRDISKPFEETIEENWPKEEIPSQPQVPKRQSDKTAKPLPVPVRSFERKSVPEPRVKMKKERMWSGSRMQSPIPPFKEGGKSQPSKLVQFEDASLQADHNNTLAEDIRNADFKKAVILSEILQRPYNY